MNDTMIKAVLVAALLAVAGCSTYNSHMPDWAKIGSNDIEETESSQPIENAWTWWNPFSW